MAIEGYKYLTQEQVDHFMTYGYLRITNAFAREKAYEWTKDVWTRLGYSPDDKSTWLRERLNMPSHKFEVAQTFSPAAWGAMCELLGGEDRIDPKSAKWTDGLIVNLGADSYEDNWLEPEKLDNWHVDGDFFVHFLDSPEQGLLVIPIFSDIKPRGGGTMISPDGIGIMARFLRDHPEGIHPGNRTPTGFNFLEKIKQCRVFHEMTGNVGDVILLHPLMLHSASRNSTRIPRIITNPPVALREPFNFDRNNPDAYSLVEKKTLKELGVERLAGWKITANREAVIPERVRLQAAMKEAEDRRLRGEDLGGVGANGEVWGGRSTALVTTATA